MRRIARVLTLTLVVVAAASSLTAQTLADTQTVPVPVYLDREYLGEIDAQITDETSVRIQPVALLAMISDRLKPELAARANELFALDVNGTLPDGAQVVWVDTGSFNTLGITVAFDWDELAIRIAIPPEVGRPQRISLTGGSAQPVGTPIAPASLSAIANLDLWSRYTYEQGRFELAFTPEVAANISGVVLEAKGGVRVSDTPLFLDHARLTWDIPELGYRVEAGDLTWSDTELRNVTRVTGFSIATNDALGAPRDSIGSLLQEIYLPATSEVRVFVNESRLLQRNLAAGNYDIANPPLADGTNTIVIDWQDADGPREVELIVPYDGDLLEPGRFDAGVALGVANREIVRPVVVSTQAFGVTPAFTLGLREGVELFDLQADAGLNAILATTAGTFTFDPSVGLGPGERFSWDVPLRYYYLDSRPSQYLSFGLTGTYRSVTVSAAEAPVSSLNATGYISFALPDGFSVTPRASYTLSLADLSQKADLRASLRKSIRGGSNISANVGFTYDGAPSFVATVTYSASLPDYQQNLFLQENLATQELNAYWSRYAGERINDFDLNAAAKIPVDFDQPLNLSGQVGYVSSMFRATLEHGLSGILATGDLRNATSIDLQSAIVAADGAVGITTPVTDSFALVVPSGDFADADVSVSRSGTNDLTLHGNVGVLPNLASYAPMQVSVDPVESVLGLDESELRYVLSPTYRSGTVIRAAPVKKSYAGGVLLDHAGRPVAYELGAWTGPDGSTGEFFTGDDGYFEVYGLVPGDYALRLPRRTDLAYTLTVPADAPDFVDLGELAPKEGE